MAAGSKDVIKIVLTEEGIDDAIKAIEAYSEKLEAKFKKIAKEFARRVYWTARDGFASALVSDVILGTQEENDVEVRFDENSYPLLIIADGKKAVFIEFGAGIYHNTSAGNSLHPWVTTPEDGTAPEVAGWTIGSYGLGNGKKTAWGYYAGGTKDRENLTVTRGTPTQKPMFNGYTMAINQLAAIVREVMAEDD